MYTEAVLVYGVILDWPRSASKLSYVGWEATTVSGWGTESEGGKLAETLRKAQVLHSLWIHLVCSPCRFQL